MRTIGSITYWSRERGFGFAEITSPVEGQPGLVEVRDTVFLHHSDLGGKIPHPNDIVTFEIVSSNNTKHRWRGKEVRIIRLAELTGSNPAVEAGVR